MTAKTLKSVSSAFAVVSAAILALALLPLCKGTPVAQEAYADSYADTHQTAPAPDHVIMPEELVGKWSPNADEFEPQYIEIRYDGDDLVYYYYGIVHPLGKGKIEDRATDFEYNHGYVALQGNHGTCACYLTNGSREYVSFYVDGASKGYITKQDDGKKFRKVGKPEAWRSYLDWPTKPGCYEETTVATAKGKTTTGAKTEASSKAKAAKVKVANLSATNVTGANALLSATAYKEPGTNVKNCGIYLGQSPATMTRVNVEAVPQVSNDYHGGKDFDIWYDLNDELGITLEPHAKYYYQFYCEVGDEVYLSDVATFATK